MRNNVMKNKIKSLSKFREWQEPNDIKDEIEDGVSYMEAPVGAQEKCCRRDYKMVGGNE